MDPYSYDAAGNIVGDGTYGFIYSDRGRMVAATTAAGTVTYSFNAQGQRAAKSGPGALVPTGQSYYVYDQAGQLLGEYDAVGNPIYETIYLGAMPVGVIKHTGAAANNDLAAVLYNLHADHIATPRIITRQDQVIVWRWDTAEGFGANGPNDNPSSLGAFTFNQRFPGQTFDAETGLFQNWNRDYDASLGRYRQSDPIGLDGGINTYAYVSANPLSAVDPNGLQPVPPMPAPAPPAPPPGGPTGNPGYTPVPDPFKPSPLLPTWNWDGVTWPNWMESRSSGKDRATDVPSWARGKSRNTGESCGDFAKRILEEHYGCDDPRAKDRGPGSEYSKIKKHCERGGK